MSFLPNDVTSLASSCGATYINVGTLLPFYRDALQEISEHLSRHGCKWVLDPVAAGVGVARTEILKGFKDYPPPSSAPRIGGTGVARHVATGRCSRNG